MCNNCINEVLENEVREHVNYQTGEKLDLERVSKLKDNAMIKVMPELWGIWNFEKNDGLGYDIWKMSFKINKKVWWYCPKCNDTYPQTINGKTDGRGCSICTSHYVTEVNSLATNRPDIAEEWHPTLNGDLTPNDVSVKSSKKVWWQCLNHESHKWFAHIVDRTTKTNSCPYCASRKLMVGFNDMWTTNPQLAKLLANPEDGYRYMQFSNVRVDWKCGCGELIKSKKITDVNGQGLHCKKCADGVSFSEKIMFYLFKEIGIEFKSEKIFNWSYNKRYDFYFVHNNQKILIEAHGRQHYIQTSRKGARTLEEERENDKYKYEMAVANGIDSENYIVIDCRYSEFEYIKNNILNSRLAELFDLSNVDWLSIRIKSQSSNKLDILKLHNDGVNGKDIANKMGLNRTTVYSTLKNYGVNISNTITKERHCIKVYQLDTNMNLIRIWNSFQEIEDILGYAKSGIKKNCLNLTGLSRGYKWMFKEDYDKYLNGDLSYIVKKKNTKATPLVQFDLNGILIKEWDNIISASEALNINKYNLKRALNGNSKISGGFKWMYKENYDKYLEEQKQNKLA